MSQERDVKKSCMTEGLSVALEMEGSIWSHVLWDTIFHTVCCVVLGIAKLKLHL